MQAINTSESIFRPILRHFSFTDGLIRGAGLANYVILNAAFALLPGFGIHGLLIANSIQNILMGLLELPFGWIADRFGWAKAVKISYGLKISVPLIMLGAVAAAYVDAQFWCWFLITVQAVVDAFVNSLQNGAYEVAYTEWYRVEARKRLEAANLTAPPLFIRSLRYSMWIRLAIPFSIVGLVLLLHFAPIGLAGINSYAATFIGLSYVFVLRVACFVRILRDLRSLGEVEAGRVERQKLVKGAQLISAIWNPIKNHLSAFTLYSVACFQYLLSCAYIAGIGMQEMNKLSLPQPYGWVASVGLTLGVYVLDSLFWLAVGYRVDRSNAVVWIKNLGLGLLATSLMTGAMHTLGMNPLLQSFGFASCTLFGILCAGAIKRFFASHIKEWLKSDLVATWLSVAECIAILALGLLGSVIVYLDHIVPSPVSLLVTSVLIALAIIYYLSCGALTGQKDPVSLRNLFARTFSSVAVLAGAAMGVVMIYVSIGGLVDQREKLEEVQLSSIRESLELARVSDLNLRSSTRSLPRGFEANVCLFSGDFDNSIELPRCEGRPPIAYKLYSMIVTGSDFGVDSIVIRFDRTELVVAALKPLLLVLVFLTIGAASLYLVLQKVTQQVHHELENLLHHADPGKGFTITEFRDLTRQLDLMEKLKADVARHKILADLSARVAHDIRSPLTAFQILLTQTSKLPAETEALLNRAIKRVKEVADDLLLAERQIRSGGVDMAPPILSESPRPLRPRLIPSLVKDAVALKQVCVGTRSDLSLNLHIEPAAMASFAAVDGQLLKSLLSNVIQNSVEAISGEGRIDVRVGRDAGWLNILVSDNGKGIPKAIVAKLLHSKTSYGKASGNGLGLYNAAIWMKRWGGEISIESDERLGTKVRLLIPSVPAPNWYASELTVGRRGDVCILDDEPSIHKIWVQRFAFAHQNHPELKLWHFHRTRELSNWLAKRKSDLPAKFLIDQELVNDPSNGMELIRSSDLRHHQCFLVTNHSDEDWLIEHCEELTIKIIPKFLLTNLPIKLEDSPLSTEQRPYLHEYVSQ